MKNIKKVVSAFVIATFLMLGTVATNAGVIVNFTKDRTEAGCFETKSHVQAFDSGVIVNLTGVIVNFTGVIVNFTGVIVNYTDTSTSECGHLPTGD